MGRIVIEYDTCVCSGFGQLAADILRDLPHQSLGPSGCAGIDPIGMFAMPATQLSLPQDHAQTR